MNRFYPLDNPIECRPLNTNRELFSFDESVVPWSSQVKPLKERAAPRELMNNYELLSFTNPRPIQEQINREKDRRKVLVCHDLMGNYKGDAALDKISDEYSSYRWV